MSSSRSKGLICIPHRENMLFQLEEPIEKRNIQGKNGRFFGYILTKALFQKKIYFWCQTCEAVPLQAWRGPEGSRKLRLQDFMTTAQDGGKFVSLTHRPLLLPRKCSWYSFLLRGWVDPRAIVRSVGFYVKEKSIDTIWDRTSDLQICSTAP
jgi:hypothetical protein